MKPNIETGIKTYWNFMYTSLISTMRYTRGWSYGDTPIEALVRYFKRFKSLKEVNSDCFITSKYKAPAAFICYNGQFKRVKIKSSATIEINVMSKKYTKPTKRALLKLKEPINIDEV